MLDGQVVIVTGGAGLLGQAIVEAIIKENGIAVIADSDVRRGLSLKSDCLVAYPHSVVDFVEVDICNLDSVNMLIEGISKKFGKVDALINNAYPRNRNYGRKFFEVEYSDFCDNTNMHLGGYFLVSQQIAKFFIMQGWGNIISISSIYGLIPPKFEIYDDTDMTMPVEYAVIKSGVIHLTKYLAKFLKGKNIRVNAVCPGGIAADQPEAFLAAYRQQCLNKGMLSKSDVCGTVVYLLSPMSKFVNGQALVVDDGFSL